MLGSALQGVLTAVDTAAVLGLIALLSARAPAASAGSQGGRIRPSRGLVVVLTLAFLSFAGLALTAFAQWNGGGGALTVGLAFAAGGLVMATSLTPAYDVTWDAVSLTGPASYAIWPFGPRRARIAFDAIVAAGTDALGSHYVTDSAGNKVRWNPVFAGYPALMLAIEDARPDLFPPGD